MWSLHELQVLNEYTKEHSEEELESFYFEFGGIPRAIYNAKFWKGGILSASNAHVCPKLQIPFFLS